MCRSITESVLAVCVNVMNSVDSIIVIRTARAPEVHRRKLVGSVRCV